MKTLLRTVFPSLLLVALVAGAAYYSLHRTSGTNLVAREPGTLFTLDSTNVYFKGVPLEPGQLSPKTFSVVFAFSAEDWIVKDAYAVFEVFVPEQTILSSSTPIFPGLLPFDPATVRALASQNAFGLPEHPDPRFYLADRTQVFCFNNPGELWKIPADPATFSLIPYTAQDLEGRQSRCAVYTRDKEKVFYAGDEVVGADPATFRVIDSSHGKDATRTFFKLFPLEGENQKNY